MYQNHYRILLGISKADVDGDGTVKFEEWMTWINQKKMNLDRKKFLLNPVKSFIVIISIIQLIIGISDRIEKFHVCGWSKCHDPRIFHDKMIFQACMRFQPWRYITHALVHHGLPHLCINLCTQLFFGKFN